MPLNHPEYAHGISDADLIKEAIEFCNEELDGFNGMEYDSDSEVCCQRSNTFIRELVHRMFVAREAFRAGWKVNAVGTDVHSQEYLDGCEAVDWDEFIKANPGRAGAFYDAAALAAAEERGRSEERERCAVAAVSITTGMREFRVSLIARAVRQSLRNYGHKVAESALPECIAADVERTLVADEKAWETKPAKPPRDCGINGGDLLESRDNIGSAYTRSTTPPTITKEPTP